MIKASSTCMVSCRRIVKTLFAALLVALGLLSGVVWAAPQNPISAPSSGPAPRVIELHIGDEIEPIVAEYVSDGIEQAARERQHSF